MTLDGQHRAILARLADELIPADEGMPSASEAGVAGEWLDAVLAARPDLADSLKCVIEQAKGREPAEFLAAARANDAAAFGVLAEVVPAAYFMSPAVQARIGYSGQSPQPIDPRPDYLDEGLLDSVIRRGPIYRPTPGTDH
jgi:hypothetical protein